MEELLFMGDREAVNPRLRRWPQTRSPRHVLYGQRSTVSREFLKNLWRVRGEETGGGKRRAAGGGGRGASRELRWRGGRGGGWGARGGGGGGAGLGALWGWGHSGSRLA